MQMRKLKPLNIYQNLLIPEREPRQNSFLYLHPSVLQYLLSEAKQALSVQTADCPCCIIHEQAYARIGMAKEAADTASQAKDGELLGRLKLTFAQNAAASSIFDTIRDRLSFQGVSQFLLSLYLHFSLLSKFVICPWTKRCLKL